MGKREAVEKAKAELEATIKDIVRESLFSNVSYTCSIQIRHNRNL